MVDGDAGRLRAAARVLAPSRLARPVSPFWLAGLSAVIAFDYLFTKVLGVVPLGVFLIATLIERTRRRPDFRRLVAIGASVLAVAAAAVIALLFLTAGWYATLLDPKALPLDVARAFRDGDVIRGRSACCR